MMSDFQDAFDSFQYFNPFTVAQPAAAAVPRGIFTERRFTGPTGSRSYKLYVPACAEAGVALPLVVMLHGCTQSPDDFAAGTRMNDWAERDGFLVCYPAQTSSANGQRCWNWFKDVDQKRDSGEPALIAGITRDVMARQPVDPAASTWPACRPAARWPPPWGSVTPTSTPRWGSIPASPAGPPTTSTPLSRRCARARARTSPRRGPGPCRPSCSTATGIPPCIPSTPTRSPRRPPTPPRSRRRARTGRWPGGAATAARATSTAAGRALVEQWIVHGSGHAWSGGSTAGSYTDPQGPDASGEMLRFFAEHVGAAAA